MPSWHVLVLTLTIDQISVDSFSSDPFKFDKNELVLPSAGSTRPPI